MTLARGFHFRAQDGIGLREFRKREHRLLDGEVRRHAFDRRVEFPKLAANHGARGDFRQRHSRGLGYDGTVREARGLTSSTYTMPFCTAKLYVHQAHDVQRHGELARLIADFILDNGTQTVRWQ